jgi:hypothetical protein
VHIQQVELDSAETTYYEKLLQMKDDDGAEESEVSGKAMHVAIRDGRYFTIRER